MGKNRKILKTSQKPKKAGGISPYWLVTADNQLGAIHWGNPQREEDYYRSFQRICKMAAEDPDCLGVLGLGDVRERAGIQAKNLEGMNLGLRMLLESGKPMLAIMGNHDHTRPNWIEAMKYPCLHNLADKAVQEKFGFNPQTTLALDFQPKTSLEEVIASACDPEKVRIAFLHQSLRELTTNLRQSYDTSLSRLEEIGFGAVGPCLILLGDLHNFGDAKSPSDRVQGAYPGSPEMTDTNEGYNGLKSDVVQTCPHDYRKFVIRYFPSDNSWEPLQINPRPWFRGKSKTAKEALRMVGQLEEAASDWKEPGIVALTCPKREMGLVRDALQKIPVLEARVEEYDPSAENPEDWGDTNQEATLSWPENKKALLALAQEAGLDSEALALLSEIVARDGSTPNAKNDVGNAWNAWAKPKEVQEAPETPEKNP